MVHFNESQEERVSGTYKHREWVEDANASATTPFTSVLSLFVAAGLGVRYSDVVMTWYHSSVEKATFTFLIMSDAVQKWWIQVSERSTMSDTLTEASLTLTSHVPYNTSVAGFILYVSVAIVLAHLIFEAIYATKRSLISQLTSKEHTPIVRKKKTQRCRCKTPPTTVRKRKSQVSRKEQVEFWKELYEAKFGNTPRGKYAKNINWLQTQIKGERN